MIIHFTTLCGFLQVFYDIYPVGIALKIFRDTGDCRMLKNWLWGFFELRKKIFLKAGQSNSRSKNFIFALAH